MEEKINVKRQLQNELDFLRKESERLELTVKIIENKEKLNIFQETIFREAQKFVIKALQIVDAGVRTTEVLEKLGLIQPQEITETEDESTIILPK